MTILDNLMVISQEEYACLRCDLKVAELKEKQWQSIAEKLAKYLEKMCNGTLCNMCQFDCAYTVKDRGEWLLEAREELGIKDGKTPREKFIEAVKRSKQWRNNV